MDDLPGVVLVEILCRLPCYKSAFRSKCVSKRWCTLISSPSFIGRFLSDKEKSPVIRRTLINKTGVRLSSSSTNLLAPVFKRLMRFHGLENEPLVLGTYNDLVLCCQQKTDNYYICNPYTAKWVALPPPSPRRRDVLPIHPPAGLICDRNYYDYKEGGGEYSISLNAFSRCRVVRILYLEPEDRYGLFSRPTKFTAEIFSSETGEWKKYVVASPVPLQLFRIRNAYACNGMLYWWDGCFVGMDPFMINNNGNADYKLSLLEFPDQVLPYKGEMECIGVCRGSLRMSYYHQESDTLYFWDWKEQDSDDHDQNEDGSSKFRWKQTTVVSLELTTAYPLFLALDPNDEELYVPSC